MDLGTGDGRLIRLIKANRSDIEEAVALDVSPTMLKSAREHFAKVGFHNPNYVLGFLYCLMTAVFRSLPIHHDTHVVIVLSYRAKGQVK